MTRTLENQTLLYDTDCPLCRVYTKGFIDAGMLDENGKKPYCQLSKDEQNFIDIKRASNEIALVDNDNKTVVYGIDSLLKIIGFSFPWIEKIGNLIPIKFLLKKFYSFISYNRKVIIPSKVNKEIALPCVPDFNYKYRFIYIVFAFLVSSFIFFKFINLLYFEYLSLGTIAFGVFVELPLQILFLIKYNKIIVINYLGNLVTISFFGGLLLLPVFFLNQFFDVGFAYNLIYFIATILIMFYEHYRRLKILELPPFLSIVLISIVLPMLYSLL